MPDFTYEALARTGQKSTGTLTASSEREAALILDGRGLFPVKILLAKTQASGAGGFFAGRVSGRQAATFYSQLADLLHSGVPLLRSLELLERQSTNRTLQSVLREVRAKVADGTGLAQAMGQHPYVFNDLAVSMCLLYGPRHKHDRLNALLDHLRAQPAAERTSFFVIYRFAPAGERAAARSGN